MSVKNRSRDVLVSRNSSQMALDESVSKSACKKMFDVSIYRNIFVIVTNLYFVNVYVS